MGKENKFSKTILNKVKRLSDKQIENTIEGKCLFLCFQPTIPKKIKNKMK